MKYTLLLQLMITILWLLVAAVVVSISAYTTPPIGRPGCRESCQNSAVKIPFPFGVGTGCYHDPWYEIVCNSSSDSSGALSRPSLRRFNLEVLNILSCVSSNGYDMYFKPTCSYADLRLEVATKWQNICTTAADNPLQLVSSLDLKESPFYFSMEYNVFVMGGCPGHAAVMNKSGDIVGGCSSVCRGGNTTVGKTSNTCDGLGCCLIQPTDSDFYKIRFRNCLKVALMEGFSQAKIIERLSSTHPFPTVWHWNAPDLPRATLNSKTDNVCCSRNCNFKGCSNICLCDFPYVGNPYIPYGCQDICKAVENHLVFQCKKSRMPWVKVLGLNIGGLGLVLFCYGLYRWAKRWIEIKQRENSLGKTVVYYYNSKWFLETVKLREQ